MRQSRTDRPGFILVLVLVVLVLAGMGLAAMARRSSRAALQAGAAAADLREKWALRSCHRAVLGQAERLLRHAEVEAGKPVFRTDHRLTVSNLDLRLAIADEQAKANVNRIGELGGQPAVTEALNRLQAGLASIETLDLRPYPAEEDSSLAIPLPAYDHYDQLLINCRPDTWTDPLVPTLTDRVTCWGSGKLHLFRTETSVLRAALQEVLAGRDLAELLQWRELNPDGTLYEALSALELSPGQRGRLIEWLTDFSGCHSLHIQADNGVRRCHVRIIRREDGDERRDTVMEWEGS